MIFNINAALLDALVLAIVKKEDTYGYEITRVLKNELDVSESTLYPVLRRLQRTIVSKFMTKSIPDETGVITR